MILSNLFGCKLIRTEVLLSLKQTPDNGLRSVSGRRSKAIANARKKPVKR